MKKLFFLFGLLTIAFAFSNDALAQKEGYGGTTETPGQGGDGETGGGPTVRDGLYDKIAIKEKKILAYDHVREADVFWQKRIWRVVDTRQKMNQSFTYPERPFINVLLDKVKANGPGSDSEIRVFRDDAFLNQTSWDELKTILNSVDTTYVVDPDTYEETMVVVENDFNWQTVTKFRMKEDWVFDEESSQMIVRILAIAPIEDVIDDNGNYRGQRAMFYAYYPDLRQHLMNEEVIGSFNDAMRLTWDDLFEMRYFGSFVMKESNIEDRRIEDYATGRDALLESERIKEEIFLKEHNLWSY
ncbi:MAG: gliding motility protein GldN [Chitinophagales bacterium]